MEHENCFEYIPLEIFIEILMNIDGVTLGKCRRVCQQWKQYIDLNDQIWQEMCRREYKYSSKIAKRKAGNDLQWYHIYKNLKKWSNITRHDNKVTEFYTFLNHDKSHACNIDYGLLPLKDGEGVVLFKISTRKFLPITICDKNCIKIANNHIASVILTRVGLFVQKCVGPGYETEKFFEAQNFVLSGEKLYYYCCKNVYKCDLNSATITSKLIFSSNYLIKEIQYCDKILYLFTLCGMILNITNDKFVKVKPMNCPTEWLKSLKNIHAINDRNFVCYSPQIFKLDSDKYHHLYLEFPLITALFFYPDDVLIGTKTGEILLFRLSSQKKGPGSRPIFDTLAVLPDGKFATQLDVCERRNGPVIVVTTFFEIYLIEYNFFPHETQPESNIEDKQAMYKRLLRLNERLKVYRI